MKMEIQHADAIKLHMHALAYTSTNRLFVSFIEWRSCTAKQMFKITREDHQSFDYIPAHSPSGKQQSKPSRRAATPPPLSRLPHEQTLLSLNEAACTPRTEDSLGTMTFL